MTIRDIVRLKASRLNMDGYKIAHAARELNGGEFVFSVDHMCRYLRGEKDMSTQKLDYVFDVLGLDLCDKVPFTRSA